MAAPYIVLNFKMAPERRREVLFLCKEIAKLSRASRKVRMVACPPFPYLSFAEGKIGAATLGAQTLACGGQTAQTGEVSALMLKEFGVRFVIVGHSERRALGEDDVMIAAKVRRALERNLRPIICVGERERTSEGDYLVHIADQVQSAIQGLPPEFFSRVLFAYEPIWAIGKSAADALAPEEIHQTLLFIRKIIADLFSREIASTIPVLYGGSVKAENARELLTKGHADGLLVGSASIDKEELGQLLKELKTNR